MLEFHIHGSNATKKYMLEVLNKFPKFREAEPVSAFECGAATYIFIGGVYETSFAK